MKRFSALVISLVMMITSIFCVNLTAQAADTVASGSCGASGYNMSWRLDSDGVLTISGANQRMADYYNNSPSWSGNADNIKKVVIENGVINIGANAFKDCKSITEVSFGTIDTIGEGAFSGCTSLKWAILPDSCTWIWANAFSGCTSLRTAYINAVNSYANSVPEGMFNGCTSLSVVELGSSINTFSANCFAGCTSLSAIIVNSTSLSIANSNAFSGVNKAGCCLISQSGGISSFASSNGFAYEASASGIVSDNTYSSARLTYSWNTKTCTLSFSGSGDLKYYDNSTQPYYKFTGGCRKVDFSGTDARVTISTTAFQGRDAIEELDLTNVAAIGWGAFAECSSIKDLHFDASLTEIWNYAFANDTSVNTIIFDEGSANVHIYPYAFNNCSGTTYWLNLPATVKYIDDHAFIGTNFNYIKIFASDAQIGEDAFGNGDGGYARFFSAAATNTTTYDYVRASREEKGYNWHYYCIDDLHTYTTFTVEPTCTEQGYQAYGCPYCDADKTMADFIDALGHDYIITDTKNAVFVYDCARCGLSNIELAAIELKDYFENAISTIAERDDRYHQYNYDGRLDVKRDGVINAKDYSVIESAINSPDVENKETTIDLSATHQTIEGFGASGAWWAQSVGAWENADEIISLLYDEEDGIGLDIYRYNLGAGSRDINDTTMYIDDERTSCFLQPNGTYNWNNDANAMQALSIARSHNPDLKVTLFANSPPVYMTTNGKAYVSPDASSNIAKSRYQDYANYIVACAEHFIDSGYNVNEVSPINEPEWGWNGWVLDNGDVSCGQEGCHWGYSEALDFYNNYMVPTLKNSSKCNGTVGLSVWECAQMYHSDHWANYLNNLFSSKATRKILNYVIEQGYAENNANIRSYVNAVDTHSYWADPAARQNTINDIRGQYFGQKVRCTEYCQMYNDYNTGVVAHINAEGGSTNGMTIDYGLAMADIIYQDMTILDAVEWDWWTAVGRGIYTDSLIYVKNGNHSYETSKRLWCLGNYSKFIDEGAVRVDVTTGSAFGADLHTNDENIYTWDDQYGNHVVDKNNYIEQSAYLNPDGTVAVVYINNSDTVEYTTFDSSIFTSFTSYVTDARRDLEKFQSSGTSNACCIPARSVTTVVLRTGGEPVESQEGAYLFAYFTGNEVANQTIHLAVSTDGYNFTALNNNRPVITQTLGTKCCRDPYIFLGQDGYYYIVATDMDASTNQWWGNSHSIIYWRSRDLVHWSDETLIDMYSILPNVDDIQRFWAPQVIWDEKEQKYLVYFALASWTVTQNVTSMYYCYADDLLDYNTYTDPQLLYASDDGGLTLDGDIIFDSSSGTYYLYFKDEEEQRIYYATSKNLTGPYTNTTLAINSDVGLEGCNSYFINGTDTLVMMADAYGNGYYVLNQSTDFRQFYSVPRNKYSINFSPRHGSVISISDQQYNALVSAY